MKPTTLEALGFNDQFKEYRKAKQLDAFLLGRVSLEHRERYMVLTEQGEIEAELLGNLRFAAQSRRDFPAVGDWVALSAYDDHKGLIHAVYPRSSLLERQTVGKTGEKQIIATNIDYGLVLQSLNRDFSINRMERYLTICNNSNIQPIILLTKIDLVEADQVQASLEKIRERVADVPILALSNATGEGLEALQAMVMPGKTYCLLGSSGVGKSTLINSLAGHELMPTGAISESIDRGKHVTTHRELIVLDTGGILIDNPGMREVGIADGAAGMQLTFEQIYELAEQCKFNDCTHVNEKGCAILAALDSGALHEQTYENYLKLEREQAHYSATVHERRKREKRFGKMVKRIVKQKKGEKY
jgi:ribosome biogenesis GTPase